MNIALEKLAKKYAQAFINMYGALFDVELIEKIDMLARYLAVHRQALFYVQISVLDKGRTKNKLDEVLHQCGVEPLLRPLINLLIDHKRMFLLARIMKWISILALENKNIMKFTIESAPALNEDELARVQAFLTKETGKRIIYKTLVNKDLIAGLKVYSETMGFERSIRKQLRALRGIA